MQVDGVFSGGGMKALAFIGALEELQEQGYTFERIAGTSAGAILASLTIAGYSAKELKEKIKDISFDELVDVPITDRLFPFTKWLLLYFKLGLYKGNKLECVLEEWLQEKGVRTFAHIPPGSLKVICSDLTLGRMVVIPDDLKKVYGIDPATFSVAKAVRMSSGLPYFFIPVKIHGKKGKSVIVDGGVLSNFPIWLWEGKSGVRKRPIIGMKLTDRPERLPERKITNAIAMFHALFKTMQQAHDARHISPKTSKDVIFIPMEEVEVTNFNMSEEEKERIMNIGNDRARTFLKRWKH
ncbi:patatin-like phospholipase family protein [Halobacillus yeomjeoni]|uniref:patatin-like phospholipase family protein n=1 Tax=Halobacillus yeomjeoni TaxID=311194 RepID=UPI001CD258CD|nr:patatin-like phospholipase family protein [Halobacillus yeomjeoni]MCA0982778.1 patatin-like phospholipase family protein [Halobacillus yeomjeoni]